MKKKQKPSKKSRPTRKPIVQNEQLKGWNEIASYGLQRRRRRCRIIDDLEVEHEETVALTTFLVNKGATASNSRNPGTARVVRMPRSLSLKATLVFHFCQL
jgi:hypothetical protein